MGSLEKAIISVRDPDPAKDTEIEQIKVLFNPEKYTLEKTANWQEKGKKKILQFISIARKSFSVDLFFDTYEAGEDVRGYTSKIVKLTDPINAKKKNPPVCIFSWGGFNFRGVIEKVTQNYTMFLSSGKPVRAVLNVTFKQFSLAQEQAKGNPPGDPSTIRIVKEGETLNLIASQEYGDPALWRIIADKNKDKIQNPRFIEAGTELIIPALEL